MTEAAAPERRAFLYALAAMNLLFLGADLAAGWPHAAAVVGARVALGLLLTGTALALGRVRRPDRARRAVQAGGVGAALALVLLAWGSGGSQSVYLPLLPLASLVFFIAVPDMPGAIFLAGVTSALSGLALLALEGVPPTRLALWCLAYASGTGYALVGSVLHVRTRARAAAAVAELERSERRRARAERLALAGRLAAGVAHGVNNPLSAAMASSAFVERALGGAGLGEPELAEALLETRQSLERIRRLMQDLSTLSRDPPQEDRGPCEIAAVVEDAARLAAVRGVVVEARDLAGALPPAFVRRGRLGHILAGLLVSAAEAGRGSGGALAPVRVAARREGGQVELVVEPVAGVRGQRRALEDDLLVVLAREQLASCGLHLEVTGGPAGEARLALSLPAAGSPSLTPIPPA